MFDRRTLLPHIGKVVKVFPHEIKHRTRPARVSYVTLTGIYLCCVAVIE